MERKPQSSKSRAQTREDRLKAALKANLARRKAQVRAKAGQGATETPDAPGPEAQNDTGDRPGTDKG